MHLEFLRQEYLKSMYLHKLIHPQVELLTRLTEPSMIITEFVRYLAASNQRLKRA